MSAQGKETCAPLELSSCSGTAEGGTLGHSEMPGSAENTRVRRLPEVHPPLPSPCGTRTLPTIQEACTTPPSQDSISEGYNPLSHTFGEI